MSSFQIFMYNIIAKMWIVWWIWIALFFLAIAITWFILLYKYYKRSKDD